MVDQRGSENSIEMLHRMISYVREEANRLHLLDVALLLEYAGEAVAAFPPTVLADGGLGFQERPEAPVEH